MRRMRPWQLAAQSQITAMGLWHNLWAAPGRAPPLPPDNNHIFWQATNHSHCMRLEVRQSGGKMYQSGVTKSAKAAAQNLPKRRQETKRRRRTLAAQS